jgi:hypothetical protein
MPSRLITGAILLFWLAMTAWLIEREVVPSMLAEISPTFQPDLTDEIGSSLVHWNVLRNGEMIGRADSKVVANNDRTYSFCSSLRLEKAHPFGIATKLLETTYCVSEEGKLKSLGLKMVLPSETFEFQGDVVGGILQPRLLHDGMPLQIPDMGTIAIRQPASFINPMHLVNRWRGLRRGQTWKISPLDFTESMKAQGAWGIVKSLIKTPSLVAEVKTDTLGWDGREVDCYKIEYSEPGREVTARTWLRKFDGLVLQQDTNHYGFDMVLQRSVDKDP